MIPSLEKRFGMEVRWREKGEINYQALQHAPGNYVLQGWLNLQVCQRIKPSTCDLLTGANLAWVRCITDGEPVLVVVYQNSEAIICHAQNLDHLDDLCMTAYSLLGVRKFAVRGKDLFWSIKRVPEGGWLKECLEGGVSQ